MDEKDVKYEEELQYEREVLGDLYADCADKWTSLDPTSEDAKYLLDRMEKIQEIRGKIPESTKEEKSKNGILEFLSHIDFAKIACSALASWGMWKCTKLILDAESEGIPYTSQAKGFTNKFNPFR